MQGKNILSNELQDLEHFRSIMRRDNPEMIVAFGYLDYDAYYNADYSNRHVAASTAIATTTTNDDSHQ